MHVRKQQLELDMKQQTGCRQEKEYIKAVFTRCLVINSNLTQQIYAYTNNQNLNNLIEQNLEIYVTKYAKAKQVLRTSKFSCDFITLRHVQSKGKKKMGFKI